MTGLVIDHEHPHTRIYTGVRGDMPKYAGPWVDNGDDWSRDLSEGRAAAVIEVQGNRFAWNVWTPHWYVGKADTLGEAKAACDSLLRGADYELGVGAN